MVDVHRIVNGKWDENCYVVGNGLQEALIIDPGSGADRIAEYIEETKLNVLAILNTHAHYDHVGAVKVLKEKYSVPYYLHSKDLKLNNMANLYITVFDGGEIVPIAAIDHYLDEIEVPVQLGGYSIQVIFTPGHTEGSVCLQIEDYLFTGDTLLNGNVGRVDLPGGHKPSLMESLRTLAKFSEDMVIYPGHGEQTSLSRELDNNERFIKAIQ